MTVSYDDEIQNELFAHRDHQGYLVEELDDFITKPEVARTLIAQDLKYLVQLNERTREMDRRTTFDADQGVWVVGRESTRETQINARIYDIPNAQLTGYLSTKQTGTRGYVVPVLVIFPLPPVPYSTMTEQNTCKAIGHSIGRYLINNEGLAKQ